MSNAPAEVLIYTQPGCPYCTRAKQLFKQLGVDYDEINISSQPGKKEEMVKKADGGKTVPQIFIDGKHIGGCDQLYELHDQEKLEPLLKMGADATDTNKKSDHELIIIGSGAAGLTAAIYAGRSGIQCLVIEGRQPGGQLTITSGVENFPGFPEGINGPKLMERMKEQAAGFNADFTAGPAVDVDFSDSPFRVETADDSVHASQSVIIATGASARWLGLDSEQKYRGRGVSACATCDGFFFKDQEVLVIGGGDSALEEALFLSRFASKVTVIHRRGELRASAMLNKRARENEKIDFLWNSELIEITGDDEKVTGARIVRHPDGHPLHKLAEGNPNVEKININCDGVFVAIGHSPNTDIFEEQLETDDDGFLITNNEVFTSIDGIFSAGDVHDTRYRQAITAAASGCKAALEVEKYLAERN